MVFTNIIIQDKCLEPIQSTQQSAQNSFYKKTLCKNLLDKKANYGVLKASN